MGQFQSSAEDQKRYQVQLKTWKDTIREIDEFERDAWRAVTPGHCRLALYWIQMMLCIFELVPRILFHVASWLITLPFVGLAWFQLSLLGATSESRIVAANTRKARTAEKVRAYRWPQLPFTQLQHHGYWIQLYAQPMLSALLHNLAHPCEPIYFDGVDVSIYRPSAPTPPPKDFCDQCCNELCSVDCSCCVDTFEAVAIRVMRCAFFVLSGYHSLQCGSCLGPCVRCWCYDPCVMGDTERGRCRICEVDEIRLARFAREAHEGKVSRTLEFFSARPHLIMRPKQIADRKTFCEPLEDGLSEPLLNAPQQKALLAV
eukprot:TRINITY_DN3086_c0_g1_i1.p1 TRINITY_DN3086_c0_g1~~TRINITY_DN3086_c0_g1_i1.p1  ORF type:complete len:316 (+),score=20.89 TRINITY_DN3086_c0_g1_i1:55-1002(+)